MKKSTAILILLLLVQFAFAQPFTIRGYVTDMITGEPLQNANIFNQKLNHGTFTQNDGFYSLTLGPGKHSISCSFVGYQTQMIAVNLQSDTVIDFKMKIKDDLKEIKVVGKRNESQLTSAQMSREDISILQIQNLPVLLGEADLIKTIQLLPGVQSGAGGTNSLYVRGGGPDQNLILLDDVPVYNAEHLLGFFSVFNSDAVNNISFYKGGFPARYGGRLSSVIDVQMKDGDEKKLKGNFSMGLIASRLNLEGPLVKDKTTYNISARRTYIDLLSKPLIATFSNGDKEGGYFFYDLNMKITHKFTNRSRINLNVYNGHDKAYFQNDSQYTNMQENWQTTDYSSLRWGNTIASLRWNYRLSNKLFANTTIVYNRYLFEVSENKTDKNLSIKNNDNAAGFNYQSGIEDYTFKMDFDYFPTPYQKVKFGENVILHTFKPGIMAFKKSNTDIRLNVDTAMGNPSIQTTELSVYFEDNIDLTARLSVNAGLHSSWFIVDNFTYASLQPRLSARWLAFNHLSFKAAYSKMSQNIHLLSSTTISLPTDLWLPTTRKVKPQNSNQYALGLVYEVNPSMDVSIEGYYKSMDHLMEYQEGASFTGASSKWEDKIEIGKGWSYGTELLLQKNTGVTTGWIGYTWSKTERQFDNLNFGRKFYARYDRRHDISIVMTHHYSKRFDVGITWVYGTGNAVTLPTQFVNTTYVPFLFNQYQSNYEYYPLRNDYRIPAYHRLDVGINFHKQTKYGIRTWNISAYNIYSRQNVFFLYFEPTTDAEYQQTGKSRKLSQLSLFPIIPSISYSYKI